MIAVSVSSPSVVVRGVGRKIVCQLHCFTTGCVFPFKIHVNSVDVYDLFKRVNAGLTFVNTAHSILFINFGYIKMKIKKIDKFPIKTDT